MEELSVIPECFVDTCLTETITAATGFNHQKGCGTVGKLMQSKLSDRFALGIIDKDKKQLPYLNQFALIGTKGAISVHKHNDKHHYIIQIQPAIESFILNAVVVKNINLADYNLPLTLKELCKVTKQETSKKNPVFKKLFRDLSDTPEFALLADLIKYIATNTYNCNSEIINDKLQ